MITAVQADFSGLSRYLDAMHRRQLPYVTARATTKLAQLSQADIRADLPRHFTLRTNWVRNGIRIQPADKRDWPAVQAIVGAIDWFMEPQVTGEERRPRGGREHLSVPGPGVRPVPSAKTPRSKWPGALLKKGGRRRAFVRRISGGVRAGQLAVLRRGTDDRYPLQVLYVFQARTKGKRRVPMLEIVRATVAEHHAAVFTNLMQTALQPKAQRK